MTVVRRGVTSIKKSTTGRAGWPPGPRWPALVQTLMWAVNPSRFGERCLARHGPLFTARILGFGRVVHVCSPDGIRRILRDDAANFDSAAANRSIEFVVGRHSLLMSDGASHVDRRRMLMPALHGSNVREYVALMESIVGQEVRAWRPGEVVRLHDCFQRVTLEVMIRAVFGITDSDRLTRLRALVPRLLDINPLIIVVPSIRRSFGGRGPWAAFQNLLAEVDAIMYAEIRDRRAAPDRIGRDVLSALLAGPVNGELSDVELRDHLVTLLAVGHETTATQLAWFFERTLRSRTGTEQVAAAVATGDQQALDAVIHEAIRVRPTTMDIGRVAINPWELDGYRFPAGTMFAVSPALMHLTAALYESPGEFRADRFAEGPSSTTFVPFGGGGHRCLGSSLAMVEMRTVISTVFQHVRLAPAREQSERIRPRGPMLTPHRAAEAVVIENALTELNLHRGR